MPPVRETRQTKVNSGSKANQPPPKPIVIHSDVIEISDSEDDVPAASLKRKSSLVLSLERNVKKLKEENQMHKNEEKNLKAELARVKKKLEKAKHETEAIKNDKHNLAAQLVRSQSEVIHLQSQVSSNPVPSKTCLPISEIEDDVTCEICTMKMWTPYILECGHMYCQCCLQDWFSTTLAQHLAAHPNYNINQQQMQMPYGMEHYMHLFANTMPQPKYTCPSCREELRNPPIEAFNVKSIVRAVASVEGESSPRKETGSSSRRKGKAPAVREDPWSGFFRKKPKA